MPVSTNECTASLNIAELPVQAAAIALLAATSRLLKRAAYTARFDEVFVATRDDLKSYRLPREVEAKGSERNGSSTSSTKASTSPCGSAS